MTILNLFFHSSSKRKCSDHFHESISENQAQPRMSSALEPFLALYVEQDQCAMPNALMYHETYIKGDGNCLFSSLIRILDFQINPSILRQQLVDSPFLNYCLNPGSAKAILSSETEYGDLDCIYIYLAWN